jgi:hypothetical protein
MSVTIGALPRERAKRPHGPAQIDGYLALADAQPTAERRIIYVTSGRP